MHPHVLSWPHFWCRHVAVNNKTPRHVQRHARARWTAVEFIFDEYHPRGVITGLSLLDSHISPHGEEALLRRLEP
jgi:hypothetical protein